MKIQKFIDWLKDLKLKPIILKNSYLPIKGFKAMNLFGVIFARNDRVLDAITINHERIHSKQIKEVMFLTGFPLIVITLTFNIPFLMLLWIFSYYIWYSAEYLINLVRFKEHHLAYRRISFEREAYTFQNDLTYLNRNNNFAFFKYIK